MQLFALYGKGGIGKTTVIKNVCDRLKENYSYQRFDLGNTTDVCYVFEINGKKVGITSYGDNADVLVKPFTFFEEQNCNIILTASRIRYTRTGSALFIYYFAEKYGTKPCWIKKDYVDQDTEYHCDYNNEIKSINDKLATWIVSKMLNQ